MKVRIFMEISPAKPAAALFMSGSGSNAERLLSELQKTSAPSWRPVAIVTDNPQGSRAAELAKSYSLPLIALDIREFYRMRGEQKISLATERGREIREEWTDELRRLLQPFRPDFGILAGFVPLCNITGDFPCLNVHPGMGRMDDACLSDSIRSLSKPPL